MQIVAPHRWRYYTRHIFKLIHTRRAAFRAMRSTSIKRQFECRAHPLRIPVRACDDDFPTAYTSRIFPQHTRTRIELIHFVAFELSHEHTYTHGPVTGAMCTCIENCSPCYEQSACSATWPGAPVCSAWLVCVSCVCV